MAIRTGEPTWPASGYESPRMVSVARLIASAYRGGMFGEARNPTERDYRSRLKPHLPPLEWDRESTLPYISAQYLLQRARLFTSHLVSPTMLTVTDPAAAKINQAVKRCLTQCYGAVNPLAALADCISDLRTRPDWTLGEIAQFESTVRRMLGALLDEHRDNPDATEGDMTDAETT